MKIKNQTYYLDILRKANINPAIDKNKAIIELVYADKLSKNNASCIVSQIIRGNYNILRVGLV